MHVGDDGKLRRSTKAENLTEAMKRASRLHDALNSLVSETEKGEQRGFANLLIGLFGTIRNPLAHNPKIEWDMSEQDALDILTMVSLIHRKLDKAHRHKAGAP
jgi:uncharacterized protein (TIGR02391 family)